MVADGERRAGDEFARRAGFLGPDADGPVEGFAGADLGCPGRVGAGEVVAEYVGAVRVAVGAVDDVD